MNSLILIRAWVGKHYSPCEILRVRKEISDLQTRVGCYQRRSSLEAHSRTSRACFATGKGWTHDRNAHSIGLFGIERSSPPAERTVVREDVSMIPEVPHPGNQALSARNQQSDPPSPIVYRTGWNWKPIRIGTAPKLFRVTESSGDLLWEMWSLCLRKTVQVFRKATCVVRTEEDWKRKPLCYAHPFLVGPSRVDEKTPDRSTTPQYISVQLPTDAKIPEAVSRVATHCPS